MMPRHFINNNNSYQFTKCIGIWFFFSALPAIEGPFYFGFLYIVRK